MKKPSLGMSTVAAVVIATAMPTFAFAAGKAYEFQISDADFGRWQRVPSTSLYDFNMPGRRAGNGILITDVNCQENGAYGVRLQRNRTGSPDATEFSFRNRSYCAVQTQNEPGWPSGEYHWDVISEVYPVPAKLGRVSATW